MSQQLMPQPWTYQFRPGAGRDDQAAGPDTPSGSKRTSRKKAARRKQSAPLITPNALAAFALLIIASLLAYVSANALAAGKEYQRQRLAREVSALRAQNAALRCSLNQAQDLSRVAGFAQAAGMHSADPALESDFIAPAPETVRAAHAAPIAWFSRGPGLVSAWAQGLNASYSYGRAEASSTRPEASSRETAGRP